MAEVDVYMALAEARKKHPQQRLGQLIWNAMALSKQWRAPEANQLFYIEDEKLSSALEKMEYKPTKPQNKKGSSEADSKLMHEIILDNLPLFHMLADNGKTRQKKPES